MTVFSSTHLCPVRLSWRSFMSSWSIFAFSSWAAISDRADSNCSEFSEKWDRNFSYFFFGILRIQTFQFSVFFSERWSQLLTTRQFSFRKSEITSDSYIFVSLWETEIQLFFIISVSNKLVLHHQSSPDHLILVNTDGVFYIIYIMTV